MAGLGKQAKILTDKQVTLAPAVVKWACQCINTYPSTRYVSSPIDTDSVLPTIPRNKANNGARRPC
jgi:hypothetical protein